MQTNDSGYMLNGIIVKDTVLHCMGWVAKLDKHGNILWQRSYLSDSTHDAYIEDLVERPGGGYVFVGATFNDTLPVWHDNRDVWLVGIDSNGCDVAGCMGWPTAVGGVVKEPMAFNIYPNPSDGSFTFVSSTKGVFGVFSIDGRMVGNYNIHEGNNDIVLPVSLVGGVYVGVFRDVGGGGPVTTRLVIKP